MAKTRQVSPELSFHLRDMERRLSALEAKVVRPAAAREAYRPLMRGPVARQTLTADSTAITADGLTDFALNNVSVEAGRSYGIHLHSRAESVALAASTEWHITARVNGTTVGSIYHWLIQAGGATSVAGRVTLDNWVIWEPTVTASTDDITIFADEIQTGQLIFYATSTQPRTLTLFDMGVALP